MYRVLVSIIAGLLVAPQACTASVVHARVYLEGTVAHTVTANLLDPGVKVTVAIDRGGRGRSESFKSMINRTHPSAAITGTFFCVKTLIPTGDIAAFGRVLHKGSVGNALCVTSDNKASVVSLSDGRRDNWRGYETVLCGGPTLVHDGRVAIALKHEGFHNTLHAPARRTAAGVTRSGKIVFVAIDRNVSLYKLAKLMVKVGITDGICLDGGSSTGLYSHGQFHIMPGRTLTNLLVVYEDSRTYESAKSDLVPPALMAKAEKLAEAPKTGSGSAALETSTSDFFARFKCALPPLAQIYPTIGPAR